MIHALRIGFVLAACALVGPSVGADRAAETSKYVTEKITVTGAVEHELMLSVDDLRKFASQVVALAQTGGKAGSLVQIKGVLLRDIIERAAVIARNHNDTKKMAVLAIASDGYTVVFSWSEIFNSPVGDGILVFFEKDGVPLGDDEGRIALISAKDIRTGPRHVKWLQSIEVRKIAE